MARYVYVLIARENDQYTTLGFLSALSVRGIDPTARISLLTDELTAQRLRTNHHRLLDVIDDLMPMSIDGSAGYCSRFLKTSMLRLVREDFIFLDVDTLAVKPIVKRSSRPESLQMALDRYLWHLTPGFPDWVEPHYQRLGWRFPTARYFNSGVMFVRANPASERLFDEWHRRWKQFQAVIGTNHDQPALNSAIDATGVDVATLPLRYNAMVSLKESYRWRARVLHFFVGEHDVDEGTEYWSLIQRVQAGDCVTIDDIRAAASRRVPMAQPWSLRRHVLAGGFRSAWRLWRARKDKRMPPHAEEI